MVPLMPARLSSWLPVRRLLPVSPAAAGVRRGGRLERQTLTSTITAANLTGITVAVTAPFARAGGTCTGTLAPGTCTITVVFSPTAVGAATGSVTINASVGVTGSPVLLSGTGLAASATLTPTTHNYGSQTRNCPTPALARA